MSSPGQPRVRRAGDAVALGFGLAVVIATALRSQRDGPFDRGVSDLIAALPAWAENAFAVGFGLSALYALGVIAAAFFGRGQRGEVARDVVAAVVLAIGLAILVVRWMDGEWPVLLPEFRRTLTRPQFPIVRVAAVTAVAAAAAPHVLRPVRRLGWVFVALVMLSGLGLGLGAASDGVAGIGLGIAAGATVMLVFGSPAGYPDKRQVMAELAQLGLPVRDLVPAPEQPWGARNLIATDLTGKPLHVKVYGRDARDAQLFSKLWRYLWYRDTGPSFSLSRLQQVEHEALVSLLAARAGVETPRVLVAATATDDSAVLVTEPRGVSFAAIEPEALTDEVLVALWQSVGSLRGASIAHGALNVDNVSLDGSTPVISGFALGSLSASADRLDTDAAELSVSLASRVGVERTVRTAAEALGNEALASVLPFVQVAAISAPTRKGAGKAKDLVNALQAEISAVTGAEVPEPAKLRRVNARDLAFTGLMVLAAYFLIKQIAGLDLAQIWDSMKNAEIAWVVAALIVAQLLLIPNATGMMAAVSAPIPLRPTVFLQSAIQFIGLAVPSAAGRIATNIAFLRKFGVSSVTALTQGALDSFTGFIVQAAILVLAFAFGDLTLNTKADFDLNWALILGLAALLIVVGFVVVWFIEVVRTRVVSVLREAFGALSALFKQPSRAMALFGSNFAAQVVLAAALWLCVRAYGASLGLLTAAVITTAAILLGGLAPTPGGIGVAEAMLAGGMVAAGLPQDVAFAAALTYRLVTFFLPPIWGFISLQWLRKNDYL